MNVSDFTYLLQHPEKVSKQEQTRQLEEVLQEYPYFQAARALHLKGLKNLNSFKYNNALKVTAAYTTDRDRLFDFITSAEFFQNNIADTISGKYDLREQEYEGEEVYANPDIDTELIENSEDEPLPRSAVDAENILDPTLFQSKDPKVDESLAKEKQQAAEELEIGKPLDFKRNEKFSFSEWLQLTSLKGIRKREPEKEDESVIESIPTGEKDFQKKQKFERIDKFIKENPKISPVSTSDVPMEIDIAASTKFDKNALMTETLAKVYLEQKKYKKAIQAYRILSLKYPEKSSFFADRIKAVQKLQKDKP